MGIAFSTLDRPQYYAKRMVKPINFFFLGPEAESVYLMGDFNDWNPSSHPMTVAKGWLVVAAGATEPRTSPVSFCRGWDTGTRPARHRHGPESSVREGVAHRSELRKGFQHVNSPRHVHPWRILDLLWGSMGS